MTRQTRAHLTVNICFFLASVWISLAAICLWFGVDARVSIRPAVAHALETEIRLDTLSDEGLKSSVDSLAIGIGAAMETMSGEQAKKVALGESLEKLTHVLSRDVYFTAWEGTRMVYAPFLPDAAGLDFSNSKDVFGNPFAADIQGHAESGGFLRITLPPLQGSDGPAQAKRVYSRSIPGTAWHIAAFMPDIQRIVAEEHASVEGSMRLGFCLLALSFFGLFAVTGFQGIRLQRACSSV